MTVEVRLITEAEWIAEGAALFGPDRLTWRFKCPVCGNVYTALDWKAAGAPAAAVAFSCIGRWQEPEERTGCDYAGGGLFRLNPVRVRDSFGTVHEVFEFAERAKS